MKRLFTVLFFTGTVSALYINCSPDCAPNFVDPDEIIYLNILQSNGQSIIKYSGNALPADSVRVTNLANGAQVARKLFKDSLLVIEEYDKNNNGVTNYKIEVGAPGVRKPDTLQTTATRVSIQDNCGNTVERTRFASVKVNNATRCTSCAYNQVYIIQK
ncbi:MAG: hypothetical protein JNM68_11590 [Dinghuibacter sp.]|nr:hypothetical protein [Dinghuibacter sp.]